MSASELATGRFKRLPQRAGEIWQGDLVPLPMWVANPADPGAPPRRPTAAIWVSLRTGLLHLRMADDAATPSPLLAFDTLVEFGLKWAKKLEGRPARVEVRDKALKDGLDRMLAAFATPVDVVGDLPAVRGALRHLEADIGQGVRIAGTLESAGVTVARLGAFADAADVFYRARPWDRLTNDDLIIVEGDDVPKTMRHITVMGNGGQQFGLSFFGSRKTFEGVLGAADPLTAMPRAHGVTFGAIDELPFGDVDAWLDHALPVAGPQAYPMLIDIGMDGPPRRPDARALTFAEALLRALADTTEDELDAGRWTIAVETFDGPCRLTFSLPLMLEAEKNGPASGAGRLPSLVTERTGAQIAKLLESGSFKSLDEVNAAFESARQQALFESDARPEDESRTALERAQDLASAAMEAYGRLRIKRARQALAISASCADAWVVLAEAASTPEAAHAHYERGVAAGERAIGQDAFTSLAGHFWGHVETRPYMRARLGLAEVSRELGQIGDAIEHYRAMLDLNPGDNLGVRYQLAATLLEARRDEDAKALLDAYADDSAATWAYARMVWTWRTEGDGPRAREAFEMAVRSNPYVIEHLLVPDTLPAMRSEYYSPGSAEEAAYVVDALTGAIRATPDILPWVMAQLRGGGGGGRGRKRAPRSPSSGTRSKPSRRR